ncbi:MAG TPA: ShlB/FhaC/HecB family hemolysin secretion/activation protein [Sphingomonadaceae bacterium]|nr:ShlB/FhaC/HecB family hemolysin secretion/activation protein [Sphingomonadaceae bacterium]
MLLVPAAGMLLAAQAVSRPPLPSTPLILDQGRADRIQPVAPPQPRGAPPAGDGLAHVDTAGSGAPIAGIRFEGAKVPAAVADAARGFIGQPATRALLDKLVRAMSAAYAKSDVALYTIAIPDQDLSQGTVRVQVAEGYIERVVYPKPASPLLRTYAARLMAEKPLSRRALERYLSLMRDVAGAKIEVQLLRGTRRGGVILSLAPTREHSDFAVGFDNQGTRDLGTGQLRAEAHGYSLLRDGDRTDLTLLGATDLKRFRYISFAHATPIGADGLTATLSAGYLETRPRHTALEGEAETIGLSLAYPLLRGYRKNLSISLGLDGLNSDAAYVGSLISSDRTRALRLAAGYSNVGTKSAISGGLTFSHGLDILGARSLAGITDTVFDKVNARATWDRQIGKRVVFRLRASGQYSRDRLAASEGFAIGGADFGRAFDSALLTGDRGAAGLVELALRPRLPKAIDGSELYGFVDGATVRMAGRLGQHARHYDLASAGAGLRLAWRDRGSIELEAARAIDDPYAGYRGHWRINIGWRLSLRRK